MFKFSSQKNIQIKAQRGVDFYDVLEYIKKHGVLANYKHPNEQKYPNQYIFVVELNNYIHYVPYVKDGDDIFLKNIIPSRKLNKKYKGKKK